MALPFDAFQRLAPPLRDEDKSRLLARLQAQFDDETDEIAAAAWAMGALAFCNIALGRHTCRVCGCWDLQACAGGCSWVEPGLCSACAAPTAITLQPAEPAMARDTLTYLTTWTDEVMPCAPTLEAWAAWLAKPDPEWNRPAPAEDGEEFTGWQCDVLGDVRADWTPDGWRLTPAPPPGSVLFYCRHYEGSPGWDVEQSGDTPEDALDMAEADDGAIWLACVSADRKVWVKFHADGPRCEIVREVQQ